MSMPGFTAEASVYKPQERYGAAAMESQSRSWQGAVAALFPIVRIRPWPIPIEIGPKLSVTYSPDPGCHGSNCAGTLTIEGQYFAPDSDVHVTVCNCELDPFPIDPPPRTSVDRSACLAVPPYTCFTIPG